jgi:hypothetical protein
LRRGVNPQWTYSDSTLATVKLILEFESLGATRTTQIMICLWIFGSEFPYKCIVAALKSELQRIVNRQERGPPWFHDHYSDLAKLSDAERSRRINQLPGLDPDLAASGIAPTAEKFLAVALMAYWGPEDAEKCASSMSSSPDFGVLANLLGIGGAIGPPEQSATGGYEVLDGVNPEELETGTYDPSSLRHYAPFARNVIRLCSNPERIQVGCCLREGREIVSDSRVDRSDRCAFLNIGSQRAPCE